MPNAITATSNDLTAKLRISRFPSLKLTIREIDVTSDTRYRAIDKFEVLTGVTSEFALSKRPA